MNLLGRDIPVRELLSRIEERLAARGLRDTSDQALVEDAPEPRVDPLSFNLGALEEHADPTRGLPLHTHRGGAGQLVVAAKWAFRKTCQVFINEALSRQRVFNGHVRDSYAQLSAEVLRLRREVETLKRERDDAVAAAERVEAAREISATASPARTATHDDDALLAASSSAPSDEGGTQAPRRRPKGDGEGTKKAGATKARRGKK